METLSLDNDLEQKPEGSNWNIESSAKNAVSEQIAAYTAHVMEIVSKTGKSVEQVVAEEKEEIRKAGSIKKFLQNQL